MGNREIKCQYHHPSYAVTVRAVHSSSNSRVKRKLNKQKRNTEFNKKIIINNRKNKHMNTKNNYNKQNKQNKEDKQEHNTQYKINRIIGNFFLQGFILPLAPTKNPV